MTKPLLIALAFCLPGCIASWDADPNSGSNYVWEPAPKLGQMSRSEYAEKWRDASIEQRKPLADTRIVHRLFDGASRTDVLAELGQPDMLGVDQFGEDVARYSLGYRREEEGGGEYNLTFVFENDIVVRVMGSFISLVN